MQTVLRVANSVMSHGSVSASEDKDIPILGMAVAYAAQEALLRTQTRSAMLAPRYPDLLEHTKVPGTLRRSICLVSEGHLLIALVRSWSVDVSWLWSDPFLSVVSHWCFRGGRQWLQLRVIVNEDASCESQSRTNSEPVVIHLRFGSCARLEGNLWCSNSSLNMSEHHKMLKKSAGSCQIYRCCGPHNEPNWFVVQGHKKLELESLELGHAWPHFQIFQISSIS